MKIELQGSLSNDGVRRYLIREFKTYQDLLASIVVAAQQPILTIVFSGVIIVYVGICHAGVLRVGRNLLLKIAGD